IGRPKLNTKAFHPSQKSTSRFKLFFLQDVASSPDALLLPKRRPSPINFRPLENGSFRWSSLPPCPPSINQHPHRLTTSPPSPGVLIPMPRHSLVPSKNGYETPENINFRRSLALCLLHHPFSNEKRSLHHLHLYFWLNFCSKYFKFCG
ncbi:hypothetical protein AABB24_010455, partial [Solanum stoloniferum]